MQPVLLLFYEKLYPGTHLVNRLQDLGYRVQTHGHAGSLLRQAEKTKPLMLVIDVGANRELVCAAIHQLTRNAKTAHLPIVAVVPPNDKETRQMARHSGANLVVHEQAILRHLEHFLQQALQLD